MRTIPHDNQAPKGEAKVRIRKLLGWGVLGQVSYVGSQFLLLVALARYSTVEDVGRFGLATAISLPIYWFFNFGIRVNQATDIRSKYLFNDFLTLRIAASLAAYGIIATIAIFWADPEVKAVLLVFGAAKGVETYSELCYGTFQKDDRMHLVAQSMMMRGFGGAILFWILMYTTTSTPLAYTGLLISWTLVVAFFDLPRAVEISRKAHNVGKVRPRVVIELALSSTPLALNAMLSALQGTTPRYVISIFLGVAALGHFTIVSYAMQAATTVTNAISQSVVARLAYYSSSNNKFAFSRVLKRFLSAIALFTSVCTAIMAFLGDRVLAIIFGSEYASQGSLLALVMVAAGFIASATVLQAGLLATRHFTTNLKIRIASFITIIFASTIGAMLWSLTGVVLGMILASALQCSTLFYVLTHMKFCDATEKET